MPLPIPKEGLGVGAGLRCTCVLCWVPGAAVCTPGGIETCTVSKCRQTGLEERTAPANRTSAPYGTWSRRNLSRSGRPLDRNYSPFPSLHYQEHEHQSKPKCTQNVPVQRKYLIHAVLLVLRVPGEHRCWPSLVCSQQAHNNTATKCIWCICLYTAQPTHFHTS